MTGSSSRDCPQSVPLSFADQPELFPNERSPKCLRFELGNCHGPCVSACSRTEYGSGVRAVKAFLDGRDRTILMKLKAMMEAAADALQFEKAMALRDRLQALEWVDARLTLLRQARNRNSFVYPLAGHDGRTRWYLIHRGEVRATCFAPESDGDRQSVKSLLASAFSQTRTERLLSASTVDSVLLVVGWFRKNAQERKKLLSRVQAAQAADASPSTV